MSSNIKGYSEYSQQYLYVLFLFLFFGGALFQINSLLFDFYICLFCCCSVLFLCVYQNLNASVLVGSVCVLVEGGGGITEIQIYVI